MADNVGYTEGSGKTIAADEIGGVHIRLGIVEPKPEAPAEPAARTARVPSDPADSRIAGFVTAPASSVPDGEAVQALTPEQMKELGELVRLEMRRRNDARLAAILLSAAIH